MAHREAPQAKPTHWQASFADSHLSVPDRATSDYLQDILDYIVFAEKFTHGKTFSEFEQDEKTVHALARTLEIIGEAIKHIPPALKAQYPEIPWRKFTDLRDQIVRSYFSLELETVWNTAQQSVPPLKPVVHAMLTKHR